MSIDSHRSMRAANFGTRPKKVAMNASPRGAQRPPRTEIVIQSPLWNAQRNARRVLRRALNEATAATATREGELALVLTDDATMRGLNRKWRRKNSATNVLSFPAQHPPPSENAVRLLGDIVIAFETCAREAHAQGLSFTDHLAHLAVHGFLHLVGYDHIADEEAHRMEALEAAILDRLHIANPYVRSRAPARVQS
jgi:probable rRNA maturation factor